MTVREAIEKLQRMPQDARLMTWNGRESDPAMVDVTFEHVVLGKWELPEAYGDDTDEPDDTPVDVVSINKYDHTLNY